MSVELLYSYEYESVKFSTRSECLSYVSDLDQYFLLLSLNEETDGSVVLSYLISDFGFKSDGLMSLAANDHDRFMNQLSCWAFARSDGYVHCQDCYLFSRCKMKDDSLDPCVEFCDHFLPADFSEVLGCE